MKEPVRIFKCNCKDFSYIQVGIPNDKPSLQEKRQHGEYIAMGCQVITIPVTQFREEPWEYCPNHSKSKKLT